MKSNSKDMMLSHARELSRKEDVFWRVEGEQYPAGPVECVGRILDWIFYHYPSEGEYDYWYFDQGERLYQRADASLLPTIHSEIYDGSGKRQEPMRFTDTEDALLFALADYYADSRSRESEIDRLHWREDPCPVQSFQLSAVIEEIANLLGEAVRVNGQERAGLVDKIKILFKEEERLRKELELIG